LKLGWIKFKWTGQTWISYCSNW